MMNAIDAKVVLGGLGLLVCAAVVSSLLIILLRPWLQRYALARPNARSSHNTPTPQGGGIAVGGCAQVTQDFFGKTIALLAMLNLGQRCG